MLLKIGRYAQLILLSMVLAVLFRWVGDKLRFLGRKIGVRNGLILFAIIGLVFNGPLELNTMNLQHSSIRTSGMTNGTRLDMFTQLKFGKDENILPESMPSFTTNQSAPSEHFSCQERKVVNSRGNCLRTISGFTPYVFKVVSRVHCSLNISDDSKGSRTSLSKPPNTCQELLSIPGTLPYGNVSRQKTSKDESQKFVVMKVMSEGEVNGGLARRSFNNLRTWCSNFKTYVYLLEFFLTLLMLLLRLVDVMFGLMGRRLGIGVRVSITVFTLGFVLKYINAPPSTLFRHDFATLIYVMGHFLFFLSLIIEKTQRQQLSYLLAGMAFACVTLSLLGYTFSHIPSEYAWAGFALSSSLFYFLH